MICPEFRLLRWILGITSRASSLSSKWSWAKLASRSGERLLQNIKNPVTKYLPSNCRKIGLSHSSEKLVDMHSCIANINEEMDIVFVLGAMAYGRIDKDYVEDYVSNYLGFCLQSPNAI
ncbi:ribosomal RNA small subunit methyltransferase NEP1-like isoform X2 [Salvia hispanica]|uniref:ribosomal RNA small subunit methyltransferase NEP1-like isoform X2 n=1 Tax=Salvia hispanica TaxID=49212 RepID=UPI002009B283|nr:ribosomal RNA small subunit methyltransferase NEP1-like isoform X2 [Salvia hispanica]